MPALPDTIERLDRAVGEQLERQVRNHHRRRLARLGHAHVFDPPDASLWAAGDPPPRPGNELKVLVDGERAIGEICAAIEQARSHVHIAGWHVTPRFKRIRDELTQGTDISCVLDARERTMHCHHEKLVIVDDEVAFVGGIDLTSLSGDRWDHDEHPARGRLGWHDVATRLRGPAVADVAEHFRARWQEVASEPLPAPRPQAAAGGTTVQVLRTWSCRSSR